MKKFRYFAGGSALYALPFLAAASLTDGTGDLGNFQLLLEGVLNFINNFAIPFIIAIGFLVFVWGMFKYFIAGGDNDEAKEKGKSLMIYATLGFVLIIIFWGVINLLTSSTGLQDEKVLSTPKIVIPAGTAGTPAPVTP